MKRVLSIMLVLTIFVLAKQGSPTSKVYLTPQGTESSDVNQALTYNTLGEAYDAQIKIGNDWEIINIQ